MLELYVEMPGDKVDIKINDFDVPKSEKANLKMKNKFGEEVCFITDQEFLLKLMKELMNYHYDQPTYGELKEEYSRLLKENKALEEKLKGLEK